MRQFSLYTNNIILCKLCGPPGDMNCVVSLGVLRWCWFSG